MHVCSKTIHNAMNAYLIRTSGSPFLTRLITRARKAMLFRFRNVQTSREEQKRARDCFCHTVELVLTFYGDHPIYGALWSERAC